MANHGLRGLELELAYLGGICSASLMKRQLQITSEDTHTPEDMELIDESAAEAFEMHSNLLSKGMRLTRIFKIKNE